MEIRGDLGTSPLRVGNPRMSVRRDMTRAGPKELKPSCPELRWIGFFGSGAKRSPTPTSPSPTCLTVSPALVSMKPTSVFRGWHLTAVAAARRSKALPLIRVALLHPTGTEYAPTAPKENRKSFADQGLPFPVSMARLRWRQRELVVREMRKGPVGLDAASSSIPVRARPHQPLSKDRQCCFAL